MPKHRTQSDNIKPVPRGGEAGDPAFTTHGVPDND